MSLSPQKARGTEGGNEKNKELNDEEMERVGGICGAGCRTSKPFLSICPLSPRSTPLQTPTKWGGSGTSEE